MVFAVFMSLWGKYLSCDYFYDLNLLFTKILFNIVATMFLEFWKRRQVEIAYQWDLLGFEDEEVLSLLSSCLRCSFITCVVMFSTSARNVSNSASVFLFSRMVPGYIKV